MSDTSHIEGPCLNNRISLDIPSQEPPQDCDGQTHVVENGSSMQKAELEAEKYIAKPELAELPPGFYFENKNLMWCELRKDTREPRVPVFVCSKLDVLAITRDKDGNNHGRLLEFADSDGTIKNWTLPMEMLAGDGTSYRAHLLSMGLKINSNKTAHALLSTYLNHAIPRVRVTSVQRIGWHDERFILPGRTFGQEDGERLLLQEPGHACTVYATRGDLHEWCEHVARYCVQNSSLIFSVSCGFAAPLLHLLGLEGGGFHFYGRSSSGKTTAIRLAASVWGGEQYMESWRTTVNALEGTALLHNDTLLCLDEISQMPADQVGEVSYLLANGMGKARADIRGGRRKKSNWRLLFLSSGEKTLRQCMQDARLKAQAGQEVRIVDLFAHMGKYEMFDELHGFVSGKQFSEALESYSKKFYGVAGQAFLERLLDNYEKLLEPIRLTYSDFVKRTLPEGADGQVGRVLNRFALVATAGELATKLGITGWPLGASFEATRACFHGWLRLRGGTEAREEANILAQVRLFFEKHGSSRFVPFDATFTDVKTINRAGFRRHGSCGEEFYMFTESFKQELCAGAEPNYVAEVCIKHGLLIPGSDGKATRSERLPGECKNVRCYRFTSKVLGLDEGLDEDGVPA